MRIGLALAVALTGAAALLALAPAAGAATFVGGAITADTTWTAAGSPYIVRTDVTVQGKAGADALTVLTIEPEVEVRFDGGRRLTVGTDASSTPGALVARGTAAQPIVFTSNLSSPAPGDWDGVLFRDFSRDAVSALENVTIAFGGGAGTNGALTLFKAEPVVRNVVVHDSRKAGSYVDQAGAVRIEDSTFRDNDGDGVLVNAANPQLARLTLLRNGGLGVSTITGTPNVTASTFRDNALAALRVHAESDFSGNTYDGNGQPWIEFITSTLRRDLTLPVLHDAQGRRLAYAALNDLTVQGTDGPDNVTTLTVPPGLTLRFAPPAQFRIGGTNAALAGALVARGTVAEPILFTGHTAQVPGSWPGVRFEDGTRDAASALENVTVEFATNGILTDLAQPTLRNLEVRHSGVHGIYAFTGSPRVEGSVLRDNGGHGVYARVANPVVEGCTIARNAGHGVYAETAFNQPPAVPAVTGTRFEDNAGPAFRLHITSPFGDNAYVGTPWLEFNGGIRDRDLTLPVYRDAVTGAPLAIAFLGQVTVRGTDGPDNLTTLTLEPGLELRMAAPADVIVGGTTAGTPGALVARGTEAEPILFTAHGAKVPGGWDTVRFLDGSRDGVSALENATLEFGSSQSLLIERSLPVVRNVTIRDGSGIGVYVREAAPRLERVRIVDNAGYGVFALEASPVLVDSEVSRNGNYGVFTHSSTSSPPGVVSVTGSELRDNAGPALRVHVLSDISGNTYQGTPFLEFHGGTLARDRRLELLRDDATGAAIPYALLSPVTVLGSDGPDNVTALTVDPGVTIRFGPGTDLFVGGTNPAQAGALVARGTEESPILFTTHGPKVVGYWDSLWLRDGNRDDVTVFENATVEYGGDVYAGIYLQNAAARFHNVTIRHSDVSGLRIQGGSPSLEGVQVLDNDQYGIYIDNASPRITGCTIARSGLHGVYTVSGRPVVTGNRLHDNGGPALRVAVDSDIAGNEYRGNAAAWLELNGGTLATDRRLDLLRDAASGQALAYVLTSDLTVAGRDGPDQVTALTVDPGVEVRFVSRGRLTVGTDTFDQPGALVARGTAEQPVRFTAHLTRTAGFWERLDFRDYSDDALSALENATVEFGGFGNLGGVHLFKAAPVLRNSVLRDHAPHALHVDNVDGGLVLEGNVLAGASSGIVGLNSRLVEVVRNNVSGGVNPLLGGFSDSTFRHNNFSTFTGTFHLQSTARNNLVFDNVFHRPDQRQMVRDDGPGNLWNTTRRPGTSIIGGPFLGGNAYPDYAGIDWTNPSDGLGDTLLPYRPAGTPTHGDRHPLVPPERWFPDTTPPVSAASLAGTLHPSGWYNTTVRVTLTATDDLSGVAGITFRLDGGPEQAYTGPFNVSAPGAHEVEHSATDHATNVEAPAKRAAFKVDASPPAVAIAVDAAEIHDLCFTLDAADPHSGLAALEYSVLDGAGQPIRNRTGVLVERIPASPGEYRCAGLTGDGTYKVTADARDVAGNKGRAETPFMVVDIEPPVLEVTSPRDGHVYLDRRDLGPLLRALPPPLEARASVAVLSAEVAANATDKTSGVGRGELWVDGALANRTLHPVGNAASFRWAFGPGWAPGCHLLEVRVYDRVGHVASDRRAVLLLGPDAGALPAAPPAPEAVAECAARVLGPLPAAPAAPALPPGPPLPVPLEGGSPAVPGVPVEGTGADGALAVEARRTAVPALPQA